MMKISMFMMGVALTAGFSAQAQHGLTDADVHRKIAQFQERILTLQNTDGSWPYKGYPVGITALCVLALKQAGIPSDHSSIQRGVKFIVNHVDGKTYSEGLAPFALEQVDPMTDRPRIRLAVQSLIQSIGNGGAWSYNGWPSKAWDHSTSELAALGLSAAERCGVPVPVDVKTTIWRRCRETDDVILGWKYSYPAESFLYTMSLDAQVSSGLLFPECKRYSAKSLYTLYALERVCMILDLPRVDGKAGSCQGVEAIGAPEMLCEVAFNLFFLAHGVQPVAMAQWKWATDRNRDPDCLKNWLIRANKDLGQNFTYIQGRLCECVGVKPCLIFVTGHKIFSVSDQELSLLRLFLENNGTLVVGCHSQAFIDSFETEIQTRLYPNRPAGRFMPLAVQHPVIQGIYSLTTQRVDILEYRIACKRARILRLPRDISCALNDESCTSGLAAESARQVAVNILAWAVAGKQVRHKLDRVEQIQDRATREPGAALTAEQRRIQQVFAGCRQPLGRLLHRGDSQADPTYLERLTTRLASCPGAPEFDGAENVEARNAALFDVAALFVNGHEAPDLSLSEIENIRTYVQNGGFIFASSCCSEPAFDQGFRECLRDAWPNDRLERIPGDDPIWQKPFDGRANPPSGNEAYRSVYGSDWAPLLGIRRAGRWVVIYSPVDFCCAVDGESMTDHIRPVYDADSGFHLAANILTYALSP